MMMMMIMMMISNHGFVIKINAGVLLLKRVKHLDYYP